MFGGHTYYIKRKKIDLVVKFLEVNKRLKNELKKISNEKEDSIIIYRFETLKYSSKEVLGTYEEDSNFL